MRKSGGSPRGRSDDDLRPEPAHHRSHGTNPDRHALGPLRIRGSGRYRAFGPTPRRAELGRSRTRENLVVTRATTAVRRTVLGLKSWLGWEVWGRWTSSSHRRKCAREGHHMNILVVETGPQRCRGKSCRCGERRVWGLPDEGGSAGVREPRRPEPTEPSGTPTAPD